jgi:hypothetical protein
MDRFVITRDGPGEVKEYRSRGVRGTKTGGGWSPIPADAAKWVSAETAEKALATLLAEYPENGAKVERIVPTRPRGTAEGANRILAMAAGRDANKKPEKPAKAAKAKAPERQRAPRKANKDKLVRHQCTYCQAVYKLLAQAEKCKCAGAAAARLAGMPTPAKRVELQGTVEALA